MRHADEATWTGMLLSSLGDSASHGLASTQRCTAEEFESTLNPDSLVVLENAKLEASLAKAEPAQGFQFERTGYFSRDTKSENLVFNQTVGLRDSWAKIEKQ